LITNSRLSTPSLAPFYAHTPRSNDAEGIALQLFERDWIRIILGGGGGDFLPENAEGGWPGRRKDGRNLIAEWAAQGVEVVRSKAELEQAGSWEKGRVVGLCQPARIRQPAAFPGRHDAPCD
jgi:alkaline phosphatase